MQLHQHNANAARPSATSSSYQPCDCSGIQADVLTDMCSLAERMLLSWQASSSNGQLPDEHFQALLLRAVSILLLNPWVDDDQAGRRYACHVCVQVCYAATQ